MIGIVLGLSSALLWGIGDFLARFASRSTGVFRSYFYGQIIGLIGLSLILALYTPPAASPWLILLTIFFALINTAGALLLYRALAIGILAIVSPIVSSGNSLAVLFGLLSGEAPTTIKLVGMALTLIGVPLASTNLSEWRGRPVLGRGVGEAALSALLFGFSLWGIQFLIAAAGAVWTTWLVRIASIVLLIGIALASRRSLRPPSATGWTWVAPVGMLDAGAYVAYNLGLASDSVAMVAVLSSLFSAVTVLLAWVILRERLAINQWLGVGLVLSGVLTVSLRS